MISFNGFITEALDLQGLNAQLMHLDHPHQKHILYNKAGAQLALSLGKKMHKLFQTGESKDIMVSRKVDGGVSVIIANRNGETSVSTKSAFNKDPKINFTDEDIDRNHGKTPGLADTLKHVLKHAQGLVHDDKAVQGDLIYTHNANRPTNMEPQTNGTSTRHIPNRIGITHAGPPKAMGIALHTEYDEHGIARSGISPKTIRHKKDVFVADTSFKVNPQHYDPKQQLTVDKHLKSAEELVKKYPQHFEVPQEHRDHLLTYMNALSDGLEPGQIRSPNIDDYVQHLQNKGLKEAEKVKTDKSKQAKIDKFLEMGKDVRRNRQQFNTLFKFHDHMHAVTQGLSSTLPMNKASNFITDIDGQPSTDEGVVVADKRTGQIMGKYVPQTIVHQLRHNPRFKRA